MISRILLKSSIFCLLIFSCAGIEGGSSNNSSSNSTKSYDSKVCDQWMSAAYVNYQNGNSQDCVDAYNISLDEGCGESYADKIYELMDGVDSFIPTPKRDVDKNFLMPVEDVFSITGRGTVATGRIESGIVKVGENVEIIGMDADQKSVCTGVEMFRKILDEGQAGDNAGILLRGIEKEQIQRGQVIVKPGSITPHKKFKAEVYVLKKEEGGRHTPFFKGYRPQFYFRTTDVTGSCELPSGTEMVMPGDNVNLDIELITPIAMDKELRFAIREGGHTVGAGVVTEIIE